MFGKNPDYKLIIRAILAYHPNMPSCMGGSHSLTPFELGQILDIDTEEAGRLLNEVQEEQAHDQPVLALEEVI